MAHIQFVLGGARSGKSAHAEGLAEAAGSSPVYIATAEIFDQEMDARIELHRARRGPQWQLVEAPLDLPEAIEKADNPDGVILVDCLSVWITNLLVREQDTDAACKALRQSCELQRSCGSGRQRDWTWNHPGKQALAAVP